MPRQKAANPVVTRHANGAGSACSNGVGGVVANAAAPEAAVR
ncbi:hypothetical protein [Nocardia amamiensis]|nr:hypothetical protein [Nocardia amamiensis]